MEVFILAQTFESYEKTSSLDSGVIDED
jgi:hypothetical protein